MKSICHQDLQQRTVTLLFFGGIAQVDASKSRFTLVSYLSLLASFDHEQPDVFRSEKLMTGIMTCCFERIVMVLKPRSGEF